MAWGHIGSGIQIGGGGQTSVTVNSLGAKIIIGAVAYIGASATPLTDSLGNTWVYCIQSLNAPSQNWCGMWVCLNPATSASHTFYSPNNTAASVAVTCWNGSHPTKALDQANYGTESPTTGPITPTKGGQLCISALSVGGGGAAPNNINYGFAFLVNGANNGSAFGLTLAYQLQGPTPTLVQPTWAGATGGLAPVVASFFGPANPGAFFNVF